MKSRYHIVMDPFLAVIFGKYILILYGNERAIHIIYDFLRNIEICIIGFLTREVMF